MSKKREERGMDGHGVRGLPRQWDMARPERAERAASVYRTATEVCAAHDFDPLEELVNEYKELTTLLREMDCQGHSSLAQSSTVSAMDSGNAGVRVTDHRDRFRAEVLLRRREISLALMPYVRPKLTASKTELTGKDGKDLFADISDDERVARIDAIMAKAMERAAG